MLRTSDSLGRSGSAAATALSWLWSSNVCPPVLGTVQSLPFYSQYYLKKYLLKKISPITTDLLKPKEKMLQISEHQPGDFPVFPDSTQQQKSASPLPALFHCSPFFTNNKLLIKFKVRTLGSSHLPRFILQTHIVL